VRPALDEAESFFNVATAALGCRVEQSSTCYLPAEAQFAANASLRSAGRPKAAVLT